MPFRMHRPPHIRLRPHPSSPYRGLHTATLERYAALQPTRKTLNTLTYPDLSETSLLTSANYIRNELPIRLAHRIIDMRRLPYFVLKTPPLHKVYSLYEDAFSSCAHFPQIANLQQEEEFTSVLRRLVAGGADVVDFVARGLRDVRLLSTRLSIWDDAMHAQLQKWVDALMASRISRRVLIEHHVALHAAVRNADDAALSAVVDRGVDVCTAVSSAARAAQDVSRARYGVAPEVSVTGCPDATLPFVRAHLEYILFELLKNAMRATVEHAGGAALTDVAVFVAQGPSELTIRISDAGGGLLRGERDRVFEYGYTTVEVSDSGEGGLGSVLSRRISKDSPMAGLGFGLPMSRLYARYFGGEASVVSLEGYGCDVYVTLSRTGDVLENIQV